MRHVDGPEIVPNDRDVIHHIGGTDNPFPSFQGNTCAIAMMRTDKVQVAGCRMQDAASCSVPALPSTQMGGDNKRNKGETAFARTRRIHHIRHPRAAEWQRAHWAVADSDADADADAASASAGGRVGLGGGGFSCG